MIRKNKIFFYVKEKYGITPDHPFEKSPETCVLRHREGKWFALLMKVDKIKLGLDGEGQVEVINVKSEPEMIGTLRKEPGILPAYHMNKEHWLTIVLASPVTQAQLFSMLDESYFLTKAKRVAQKLQVKN